MKSSLQIVSSVILSVSLLSAYRSYPLNTCFWRSGCGHEWIFGVMMKETHNAHGKMWQNSYFTFTYWLFLRFYVLALGFSSFIRFPLQNIFSICKIARKIQKKWISSKKSRNSLKSGWASALIKVGQELRGCVLLLLHPNSACKVTYWLLYGDNACTSYKCKCYLIISIHTHTYLAKGGLLAFKSIINVWAWCL